MHHLFTSYLSLGSNLDNKLENLQRAVNAIHDTIGNVISISKIYSTPAWGFDGNEFYNICIKIGTILEPETLLKALLGIEKTLGRKEKLTTSYENRCIDIDIILYEQRIIQTKHLTIPHPRALDRKFVLSPLFDIYNEKFTPFNHLSLKENLSQCNDKSKITTIEKHIQKP
jgi:2-amino-4-hydroxy-6-hydroxymethyldihydropteridine diphosphokinase